MTDKISVKISSVTFFACGIVLILCGCMNPVDVPALLETEIVQGIIEKSKEKVIIHPLSDDAPYLIAGNGQISGLFSNEYYRVEEYEEYDGPVVRNLFIQANGEHWEDLSLIGRLSGKQITNLKNNYTYKVIKAKPFSASTPRQYFAFGDTAVKNATVTNGAVTVIGPYTYYLDLAPLISAFKDYAVMQIPYTGTWGGDSRTSAYYNNSGNVYDITISKYIRANPIKNIGIYQYQALVFADPPPQNLNLNLDNMSTIELPLSYGTRDYVFAELDGGSVTNFVYLKIDRRGDPTPAVGDYNITGTGTFTYDGAVKTVTVTVKDAASSPGLVTVWYTGTGSTIYAKSTTAPSDAGTYSVTFDVAAAAGWNVANDLTAGTLAITKKTPALADYTISANLEQKFGGTITPVTVTAIDTARSPGAVTVWYTGTGSTTYAKSQIVPFAVGTYSVTFDVAEVTNWSAENGLAAGTLKIVNPTATVLIVSVTGFSPLYIPAIAVGSFSQNSASVSFTLTYSGSYNTVTWYTDTNVVLGTNSSLSLSYPLDSANAGWWQAKDHNIYLVLADSSGVLPPQSGSIIITVNP
jgi:hypothetical protein